MRKEKSRSDRPGKIEPKWSSYAGASEDAARNYRPWVIEPKWQEFWEKSPPYKAVEFDKKKKKFYALVEFPYPSGQGLHMGHAFTGTILDFLVRKKRMEGFNVLYPIGWDAFGLPTENYAIKTGIHPAAATVKNTARFRQQMKSLGLAYNWDREVNTTDPQYYKWTQWIFLQLFKHGLAYKAEMPVGWCPACKIVLANEEIVNGHCERCGAEAEYRRQAQWILRITNYADRLVNELDLVDYPDYVKESQRNWIGRKQWTDIVYRVEGTEEKITVSTTRPDTNFGATFVVLAPEHPLVEKILSGELPVEQTKIKEIKAYVEAAKHKSERDRITEGEVKTGVFTGLYAVNQLNNYRMPIWITDFVLVSVGTGAVVGVPGHDIRDFEFAQQFKLPIIRVVVGKDQDESPISRRDQTLEEEGVAINSGFLDGLKTSAAIKKISSFLEEKGWGKKTVRYHLRDWIFSRQHYWGEPIPMIYCPACAKKGITWWESKGVQSSGFRKKILAGWFPVEEKDLPVELPNVKKYQPTDTGESPLASVEKWVKTKCPHCGGPAKRETDTMPNWAGSSWYFLRYCDPQNKKALADYKKLDYWLPADVYLGGAEHTTLHLLYSRFWHKFLNDLGVVPEKEPYAVRRQHGVILGEDGQKMSKSRGNVINPDEVIKKFGSDTLRLYLMFMGPYEQTMPWKTKGLEGCWRFLNRVWRLVTEAVEGVSLKPAENLERVRHQTIKKVTEDINSLKHNTALAAIMEYVNEISKSKDQISKEIIETLLLLLAPMAPHICEELWCEVLGKRYSVHQQLWPEFDPKLTQEKEIIIVVEVNGKLRGQIEVQSATLRLRSGQECRVKNEVEKLAKKEPGVAKYLVGRQIKKTIFVPGKLINFVI